MIKNVLFDLDGTITDPKIGITNSVEYALSKFDINNVKKEDLTKFIGPPLIDSFMNFYDFTKEQSEKAINLFREYFSVKGLYENKPYKNIEELLIKLKDNKSLLQKH